MRKRKKLPFFEKVVISDVAAEGKSLARIDDMVVFAKKCVPGDVVDLQIIKKKKNYLEGIPVAFHSLSKERAEPFCKYFGTCGGCSWQNLPYEKQLWYKQKLVYEQLKRIGGVDNAKMLPIVGAENNTFYRNKLEFTFSNKRWLYESEMDVPDADKNLNALGFHVPGRFDKVLDIDTCYLQRSPSNEIRNAVRKFALQNDLSFFDLRQNTGLLRNLIIRTSSTGELMVVVAFYQNDRVAIETLMDFLVATFPSITSLHYVINQKANDTILDQEIILYHGNPFIFEELENLKFKLGPKSFFQTNTEQALKLYRLTREFAGLSGEETVYDLYTGTGTIACFIAGQAKKVIGIENVPEAINDAKENARNNHLDNIHFFTGDMKDVLTPAFIAGQEKPDIIIVDPPRAGLHPDVVKTIIDAEAQKIVYVSCNPATQARDISLLLEKYKVEKAQPVDMFPHTHHVENIALLALK